MKSGLQGGIGFRLLGIDVGQTRSLAGRLAILSCSADLSCLQAAGGTTFFRYRFFAHFTPVEKLDFVWGRFAAVPGFLITTFACLFSHGFCLVPNFLPLRKIRKLLD